MPNSEVKRISADGSVGSPHVRVGHRQALFSFTFLKSEDQKVMTCLLIKRVNIEFYNVENFMLTFKA